MPMSCAQVPPEKNLLAKNRKRKQKILVNKRNKNKYQSNDREEKQRKFLVLFAVYTLLYIKIYYMAFKYQDLEIFSIKKILNEKKGKIFSSRFFILRRNLML